MDELVALSKYFYSLQESGFCDKDDVYKLVIFDYIKSLDLTSLTTEELAIVNKVLLCLYTSCFIDDITCCGLVIPLDYNPQGSEEVIPATDLEAIYARITALEDLNAEITQTLSELMTKFIEILNALLYGQ